MKKFFSMLFLLTWIFQSLLSSFFDEIQKSCNRIVVEQKIKNEEINFVQKFIYSKNETINWVINKKEINRDGKLYDVLNIKTKKGSVYISCISDSIDDLIVLNFQKNKEKQKHKKNEKNTEKTNFITSYYSPHIPFFIFDKIENFSYKKTIYSDPYQSVSSPPPIYYF